ncbi:hypothetical protein [Nocardioides marmoraquaticus]
MPALASVFGLSADPAFTYIDRGDLDQRFQYAWSLNGHVVIHGGSKQGKTWLRQRALSEDEVLVVVCLPTTSATQLLEQTLSLLGVRSTLRSAESHSVAGEIDVSAAGELGARVIGKLKTKLGIKVQGSKSSTEESVPIGRTPGDLSWVALVIEESGRSPVFENFHYLTSDVQREFAYILRAFLDYNVPCVITGVWAQSNLLDSHNGDLEGRVEELELLWSADDLDQVVERGSEALNIRFDPEVRASLVADSYQNVGLLHRLSAETCLEHGIRESSDGDVRVLDRFEAFNSARTRVARALGNRYITIMQRLCDEDSIYEDALRVMAAASDVEHNAGFPLTQLPTLMSGAGGKRHTRPNIKRKLSVIEAVQSSLEIEPPVFAWDVASNRLFVVDPSFLFFKRYGSVRWPWED